MSIWLPDLSRRSGPRYRAILEALAADVASGALPVGSRLPPQRDLAFRLKLTVGTVARAYAEAEKAGLVAGEVGRGTYVRADPPTPLPPLPEDLYVEAARAAHPEPIIDMAVNRPAGDNGAPDVARALRLLADRSDLGRLLGYRLDETPRSAQTAGARWLEHAGVDTPPDQVVVTVGGQQAIAALLSALSRVDETIFCEAFTYPGLKSAAQMLSRRVQGIAMDAQGIVPEAMDAALAGRVRPVVYLMPTVQNPTTLTMPLARREAVVAVARRHDAILIEDGIYSFLVERAPPPFARLAPERTYHIGGISKALSPGLRVGYVAAPRDGVGRLAATVNSMTLMLPSLTTELASMLIGDGTALQVAARQRAEIAARLDLARNHLQGHLGPHEIAFNVWIMLPEAWQTAAFVSEAARRGVAVGPSASFFAGPGRAPAAIRLSISAPRSRAELEQGLRVIADLLSKDPDSARVVV